MKQSENVAGCLSEGSMSQSFKAFGTQIVPGNIDTFSTVVISTGFALLTLRILDQMEIGQVQLTG